MQKMSDRIITEESLKCFQRELMDRERSEATIHKYLADVHKLMTFADGREVTKELMAAYKEWLFEEKYEVSSINSFLVAASCFLDCMGWTDAKVHTCKVQSMSFYPDEKCLTREEYRALVEKARETGKNRLVMILNTICCTGIRISELKHITMESVQTGKAVIRCKGKIRVILLSEELCVQLKMYAREQGITEGIIFRTGSGKPIDRSNIWRQMKALSVEAGVSEEKVYPHSLRHLFARTFYEEGKDLAKLADVLGHSSIETTRIYILSTGEEHRKYLERLSLLY